MENNTPTVRNVSTPNRSTEKLTTGVVTQVDNRDTPMCVTLKRSGSVSAKTREFQSIFDKTTTKTTTVTTSDVNSNTTGI